MTTPKPAVIVSPTPTSNAQSCACFPQGIPQNAVEQIIGNGNTPLIIGCSCFPGGLPQGAVGAILGSDGIATVFAREQQQASATVFAA
jgi:hypothetical protein